MKLAEMTWPEVEHMNRDVVVIYPIAALEQHSRHLPFFTDTILCEGVVTRIEAALPSETLLLPAQWLGASAHHMGMAGTLTASAGNYLRLLTEPLRCLLRHDFRRALIINGHGGNIDGYHLALRELALEFPDAWLAGMSYWDVALAETAAVLEGRRKEVGHACEFETSLMLHLRPDLVRVNQISDDELTPRPDLFRSFYMPLDMKRQTRHGGTGQPSLATAAKGKQLLEIIVDKSIAAIRAIRAKELP